MIGRMRTRTRLRAAPVASLALATTLAGQVQTEVPPVVSGAKPATVFLPPFFSRSLCPKSDCP